MKWKNTYKKLRAAGDILIRGLQDTLRVQRHNATGKLSRSFKKESSVFDLIDSNYQFDRVCGYKSIQEITVGVLTEVMTKGFVLHHGAPGRNFKINFPIYNTDIINHKSIRN